MILPTEIILFIKVFIAISILNVWLARKDKSSIWRGKDAKTLKEEFEAYGLPDWFRILTGTFKVGFSLMLIASIWFPELAKIGAAGIAVFMAGAISMHIRVSDELKKSFPAFSFLVLSLIIFFSS